MPTKVLLRNKASGKVIVLYAKPVCIGLYGGEFSFEVHDHGLLENKASFKRLIQDNIPKDCQSLSEYILGGSCVVQLPYTKQKERDLKVPMGKGAFRKFKSFYDLDDPFVQQLGLKDVAELDFKDFEIGQPVFLRLAEMDGAFPAGYYLLEVMAKSEDDEVSPP